MSGKNKDKRHFYRYNRKSNFKVHIGGKSFKAETFDYSLSGIGAEVEDSPPIDVGDTLHIDIPNSSLRFQGRVVRAEKSKAGLKIGVFRLSPFCGSLGEFKLSDILLGLQRGGKTGILSLKNGSVIKSIFINSGDMVFASSNQDADRLGHVLLMEGRLSPEQYERLLETVNKTGKRQGRVLVELGYLKPQELPWAVRHHVEHIILSVFAFEDAEFGFREGPLPKDEVIPLRLSAANLIYRGIKKIENPSYIRRECPTHDNIICFSSDPLDLFQDIRLDEEDKKLLSYVDGKTDIKQIIQLMHIGEDKILKSIYALLLTRIITVKEGEEPSIDISAEEVIGQKDMSAEVVEKIERLYQVYNSLGYYGVLRVKDTASSEEIRRAYYRMAKEFHPDRHFSLPHEEKSKLNALFSYITTAYSTLTNPTSRKQYDTALSDKPQRSFSNEETASQKFEQGMIELKRGKFSESARLFSEATYYDNSIAKYHYYYGSALRRLEKHKEAEKAVGRALKIDPFNADYLSEAGLIYLSLGFTLRAKGNFEKALKTMPTNQKAKEGLAKISEIEKAG
ncbi:MAG: DnaJ domain-containing protein [Nitrospirae bacterium]|nr:DnaJ domain-containing protein [Nitrospirota bacterium]